MNIKVNLNVCRVCLKSCSDSAVDTVKDIFSDQLLIEKFQYITQLKVVKNDGMPELLCSRCVLKLKIAYDFRKQCLLSESHIRAFVNEMNSKFQLVAEKTDGFAQSDDINLFFEETKQIDSIDLTEGNFIVSSSISNLTIQTKIDEIVDMNDPNILILKDEDQFHNYKSTDEIEFFICDSKDNCERKLMEDIESQEIIEINPRDESQESSEFDKYIELDDGKDITEDIATGDCKLDDEINKINITENINGLEDLDTNDFIDNEKIFHLIKTNDLQYEVELKETDETIENLSNLENMENEKFQDLPKNKAKDISHACQKCTKIFSSRTNLRRHELTHNDEKPFKCSECGAGFTQSGSLKTHALGHRGIKPFKCQVCNEAFTQGKTLKFHMRRHTGEKPFPCDFCKMRFRQKDCMKRHVKAKHPGNKSNSSEVFFCGLCGRLLHSKYAMDQHALKHKKHIIPLRCIVCKITFTTKEQLDDHQDKNHGTQFQCGKCSKSFAKHASLLTHMKVHLDTEKLVIENKSDPDYVCKECGKAFSIKKNLLDHLQIHILKSQPIEMHRCPICNVIFHNKESVDSHQINDHTGIQLIKFHCNACNIDFLTNQELNHHLEDKHDEINETCEILGCLEHFTSRKLYESHIMDHQILVSIESS